MEGVKAYLISVTAAAIICAIINVLVGKKGAVSSILKLLTGLFLALTVIRPAVRITVAEFGDYIGAISTEAEAVVSEGEDMAFQKMAAIIKTETEAYILDKAASLGVDLEVDVILSDTAPPLPVEVVLTGAVAPYTKNRLSALIAENLGIAKEAQQWSG